DPRSCPTRRSSDLKAIGIGEGLVGSLVVSDRKLYDRLAKNAANAGFLRLLGDRILEVIHIAVGRRSAADHLCEAEARADADEFFIYVLGLGREDVFRQPLVKIGVVRDAAKWRHRNVRVRVDEAGDDGLSAGVDRRYRTIFPRDLGGRADGDDILPTDGDRAILYHPFRAIHGYNVTADDQ